MARPHYPTQVGELSYGLYSQSLYSVYTGFPPNYQSIFQVASVMRAGQLHGSLRSIPTEICNDICIILGLMTPINFVSFIIMPPPPHHNISLATNPRTCCRQCHSLSQLFSIVQHSGAALLTKLTTCRYTSQPRYSSILWFKDGFYLSDM